MTDDVINVAYVGILAVSLISGLAASVVLSSRLSTRHPQFKPYAWGYFRGVAGTVASVLFLAGSCWAWAQLLPSQRHLAAPLIVYFLVMALAHVGIIKRHKLGWIIGTALSMNPLLCVIDGIYAYKRWNELNDISFPIRRRDHPHPVD